MIRYQKLGPPAMLVCSDLHLHNLRANVSHSGIFFFLQRENGT